MERVGASIRSWDFSHKLHLGFGRGVKLLLTGKFEQLERSDGKQITVCDRTWTLKLPSQTGLVPPKKVGDFPISQGSLRGK